MLSNRRELSHMTHRCEIGLVEGEMFIGAVEIIAELSDIVISDRDG